MRRAPPKSLRTTRRRLLAGTALAALFGAGSLRAATPPTGTPWRNWAGSLLAHPAGRFAPASEAELQTFLRTTSGPLRPVGAGHSFSALVPTDGHLIITDRLRGVLTHDTRRDGSGHIATVGAGTRLGELGDALAAIDQAMPNLPDIDRQTVAGALATATHGTGLRFTTLSATVQALRLVTASGDALDLDATSNPRAFAAACVSLGALGIVTRATLRNVAPFRLKETAAAEPVEDVLAQFEQRARAHRHFEMFPLVHSSYAIVQTIDETAEPVHNPPASPEEAAAFDQVMRSWLSVPIAERKAIIDATARQLQPETTVDTSYRVLANVRNTRFVEMEYSVPIDAGADCLRDILRTIEQRQIDIVFPLEYRYVAGDDLWLSMFEGGPRAAISVHQFAELDHASYFGAIEPIFWKYGGRPHWGKWHSLDAARLRPLYRHFDDFLAVRASLDPRGRLLNDHLRRLFGIAH